MWDVSSFLLRWMFVSNMCRDVAQIQLLPVCPSTHQPHDPMVYPNPHDASTATSIWDPLRWHETVGPHDADAAQNPTGTAHDRPVHESTWKDDCLRGVVSYPPGMQRVMALDAMRTRLVQQLASMVRHHQDTLQRYKTHVSSLERQSQSTTERNDATATAAVDTAPVTMVSDGTTPSTLDDLVQQLSLGDSGDADQPTTMQPPRATPTTPDAPPTVEQVIEAQHSLLLLRNYLPQLVAAVLKSPPAFYDETDPIAQLRTLILTSCLRDPSMGVELCWLLEAEVGRAWKALLEHRQETGRRLIVVLPADKAVVLAKIGMEKSEAFDFLQDAEQATAHGYTMGWNAHGVIESPRLPSSLSYRRCSHFGDTMQFVDRLTKISSDLRVVPTQHRYDALHQALHELNRRIRRRMITRGDVTIDMEDHRGAYDWPRIDDMSVDMIQYSVHLPLIPQVDAWPDGETRSSQDASTQSTGTSDRIPNAHVVRVLNLVVSETKILSSRERCPYLVHLEVADSGLEGNDARLYSSGVSGLGSTIGEALGLQSSDEMFAIPARSVEAVPSYGIPSELLEPSGPQPLPYLILSGPTAPDESTTKEPLVGAMEANPFPRGGYQAESQTYDYYDVVSSDYATSTYDLARQHQYEQLHQQLHLQSSTAPPPPSIPMMPPTISTGNVLLDIVFGREWLDKCKEIRDASPYGHVKGWRLASFILKAGEDIRREAFVMQIISKLQKWFKAEIPERHRPFMRPYTIMCVGGDAGLLECLSDAKSVDEVKKRTDGYTTLRDYFERAYGPPQSASRRTPPRPHDTNYRGGLSRPPTAFGLAKLADGHTGAVSFETAQDNFLRSLVGYSLVCYILQIKDRHNANILLDRVGHIMHIDFGFVLGDTPKMGKVPIFSERAPFKLSGDFWDVLGGWNVQAGGLGVQFCEMFELAFATASAHAEEIASLTEAAMLSLDSNPRAARAIANGVRARLRMRGRPGSREQKVFVMELVNAALTCWGTSTYDWLQRNMNGYQ